MKKFVTIAAAAMLAGIASVGAASAQQVKLGFAAEPYPPFTSQDASGTWVGWEVEIVTDAVGSRTDASYRMALDRMARHGIEMTSVEMALFAIMKSAECPEFRAVSAIVT
jgi:ABC-type amino acid transport substrate-binding protein